MQIGIKYSQFQKIKDAEEKEENEKDQGKFRKDIETSKRIMADIKNQRKRDLALYEQLEQDLIRFEIEEEDLQNQRSAKVERGPIMIAQEDEEYGQEDL
jgi:hypothetical protein